MARCPKLNELLLNDSERVDLHKHLSMDQGIIEESGSPEQVFGDPKSPRTRQFLQRVLDV